MTTQTPAPLLSVVIPVYNRARDLPRIVAMFGAVEEPLELVFVDDCSADQPQLESAYRDALGQLRANQQIVLLRNERKTNAAVCRNQGVDRCRGEYVFLLDADDRCTPEHLRSRRDRMRESKQAVFGAFIVEAEHFGSRRFPARNYRPGMPAERYLFSGGDFRTSTISFPTAMKSQVRFDEQMDKHQDWSLFLSTQRQGVTWDYDPRAEVTICATRRDRMTAVTDVAASLRFAGKYLDTRAFLQFVVLLSRGMVRRRRFRALLSLWTGFLAATSRPRT